jgi:carboxylesterase type B
MRKYAAVTVQKYIDTLKASGGAVADQLLELFPQIHPDSPYDKALAGMIELGGYIYWHSSTRDLARAYKAVEKPVYVYSFDQANPWAPERGAHHAADLLYWFNGYELPTGDDQKVADEMMTRLVRYVNGEAPWAEYREHEVYAFGPNGYVGMVDERGRRRQDVLDVLQKAGMHLTWKIGE